MATAQVLEEIRARLAAMEGELQALKTRVAALEQNAAVPHAAAQSTAQSAATLEKEVQKTRRVVGSVADNVSVATEFSTSSGSEAEDNTDGKETVLLSTNMHAPLKTRCLKQLQLAAPDVRFVDYKKATKRDSRARKLVVLFYVEKDDDDYRHTTRRLAKARPDCKVYVLCAKEADVCVMAEESESNVYIARVKDGELDMRGQTQQFLLDIQ